MKRDPLALKGLVVAVVTAVLNIVVWFGVDLSVDQQASITAVSGSLAALVVAWLARKDVTPVSDPRDNEGNDLTPVTEYEVYPDKFLVIDEDEWVDDEEA